MSQILSGYAVTSELLDRLAEIIRERDYKSFWTTLHGEAIATEPAYSYSGSVASALLELLEERGWTPVIDDSSTAATTIATSDVSLAICCSKDDASEGLAFLRSLSLTDAELAAYHREFWGEEWDEAVPAMREAISYIETTLALVPQRGEWSLLFIG
jgi:hypothetical protein